MSRRVIVLGGGPIGIETAVLAETRGFQTTVVEQSEVGAHIARWEHVRFFSPWALNRSPWGVAALQAAGIALAPANEFPMGREYLDLYLRPLVRAGGLSPRIRWGTSVLGVARRRALKGELVGGRGDAGPFMVSVVGPGGHEFLEADIVFDATGTYGQPNAFGPGGLNFPGEREVADLIEHWIPDATGRVRGTYANRHVLLVGNGHSAATTLQLLTDLRETEPDTRVTWALGAKPIPYSEPLDDPLPLRLELCRFANRTAAGETEGVAPMHEPIVDVQRRGDRAQVTFGDGTTVDVDQIVSNVGYRPDLDITRELQVHHCYASDGPIKLAATLLDDVERTDCLAQETPGLDALRSPETDFWVVGSKSYGRNSNFLLRVGFEQIESILLDAHV